MTEMDLHALADGEMTGDEQNALMASLSEDQQAQLNSILNLRQTLKAKLPTHECAETWKGCVQRLDDIDRVSKTEAIVSKYSYALAGVLCVAIFSAAYMHRIGGGVMDTATIQRTLNASMTGTGGFNVGNASDGATRIGMPEPQVQPQSLRLWRVDRVMVNGQTIGRYIYTDGQTDYILLVAPGVTKLPGQELSGKPGFYHDRVENNINVVSWCEGSTAFALAAPKPVPTLLSLIE